MYLVVIIDVEAIEIAKNDGIAVGTGCPSREFAALVIRGVVKALKQIAVIVVERYFLIASCSSNLFPESKCVGYAVVDD